MARSKAGAMGVFTFSLLVPLLLPAASCGPAGGLDGGNVGVTPGGRQDVAQARQEIEAGFLADPDRITIEGFLSEHDIPIAPPPDADELYASIAFAYRVPFGEPAPMGDLFVGLGSTIDLANFERPPLNLAVVIDRSGSMRNSFDDPYGSNSFYYGPSPFSFLDVLFGAFAPPPTSAGSPSKLDVVKTALDAMLDRLGPDDFLSVISFNDTSRVDLPPTAVTDKARVRSVINDIRADGATNIFGALQRGFELVDAQRSARRLNRVILLTDAQPNVGPDGSPEFVSLVRRYAKQEIGLTLLGVGWDFGDDLGGEISQLRGGNAFFLDGEERTRRLFREEFDYFVTPAAFDLDLRVRIAGGIGIRDVFGAPAYVPGTNGADVHVPTLFFSRREGGGAIVVRLTSDQAPDTSTDVVFGTLELAYTTPAGNRRIQQHRLVLPQGTPATADPPYYSQTEARRAAVLLDTAIALKESLRLARNGSYHVAAALIDEFLAYFDVATLGLSDKTDASSRGLRDERRLLERIRGLVGG